MIYKKSKFLISMVMVAIMVATSLVVQKSGFVDSSTTYNPSIGIWYSTWYAKEGNYIWVSGHGVGSQNQLLGDVNGDGKDDAVVFFSNGTWYVATSNGNGFNGYSQWVSGHGASSIKQFLGDVNGDGKDDAIVCFSNGDWYVATSNGNGFNGYTKWISGYGSGSANQFAGDVNGDGKDDAIVFYSNGDWYVAISNGNGFNAYSQWIAGHGSGSASQFIGDVNGDAKDDSIVFFASNGSWYTATSNGSGFNGYSQWISGHGNNSAKQMLADVNGDGKKDAVYFKTDGSTGADWYWARSSGVNSFTLSEVWKMRHGCGATNQMTGDVFGNGTDAPVAYYSNRGEWRALPADLYYVFPNIYNTWEAGFQNTDIGLKYIPRTNGVFNTYDSGNTAVIDEHINMISTAGIDYLILDLTNYINADNSYIKNRALILAQRINIWNSNMANRPLKYAIAIGYMQLTHLPGTMEDECNIVYDEFVNTVNGGTKNYYYMNGKPLILSYAEYNDRLTWEQYTGDKTESNRYTVRWLQGKVPTGTTPPSSDYGLYFGWSYPQGSLINSTTMVAMPGHNNQHGDFVSRKYNNINGGFYDSLCLQRILQQKPQNVIINSFNEFAEETAIQPADTTNLISPSEKWFNTSNILDPNMYWNKTVDFITQLRQ